MDGCLPRRGMAVVRSCMRQRAGGAAVDYFPEGVPGYGLAPGVTVASRARPDFDPAGVRLGSFLLHPQWEEGLGYDDNVLGSGDRKRGSWLVGTHPSLLVGSDWSRDSLGGYSRRR